MVREAVATDLVAIVRFNCAMALETEAKQLDPEIVERGVEAALKDPARALYLVAERHGSAVGCLMITREWSDWRNGFFWWIQSVYVAPADRRSGVLRALYQATRDRASCTADVCGLRLYVENDNRSAQATYQRLGMHDARYRVFEELLQPE